MSMSCGLSPMQTDAYGLPGRSHRACCPNRAAAARSSRAGTCPGQKRPVWNRCTVYFLILTVLGDRIRLCRVLFLLSMVFLVGCASPQLCLGACEQNACNRSESPDRSPGKGEVFRRSNETL